MTVTDAAPSAAMLGTGAPLVRGAHLRGPVAVCIGLPLLALVWMIATRWPEIHEAPKFRHW